MFSLTQVFHINLSKWHYCYLYPFTGRSGIFSSRIYVFQGYIRLYLLYSENFDESTSQIFSPTSTD